MKNITFFLFAFFTVSSMMINAQTTIIETEIIDISGIESWDARLDSNNSTLSLLLDGFTSITNCDDPVLEITGLGWDTNQTTVGSSWLSEMRIDIDANQDGSFDVSLIPAGAGSNFSGTGSYSSNGILDLVDDFFYIYLLIDNATSGSIDLEFLESNDNVADAVDGMYDTPSTITIQYRLSCSNTLGVEEFIDYDSLVIYPNLVENFVTLSNPKSIALYQAEIYDLYGKLIKTIDLSNMSTEKTFDVSMLASAHYFVKIRSEKGSITKRLIKK